MGAGCSSLRTTGLDQSGLAPPKNSCPPICYVQCSIQIQRKACSCLAHSVWWADLGAISNHHQLQNQDQIHQLGLRSPGCSILPCQRLLDSVWASPLSLLHVGTHTCHSNQMGTGLRKDGLTDGKALWRVKRSLKWSDYDYCMLREALGYTLASLPRAIFSQGKREVCRGGEFSNWVGRKDSVLNSFFFFFFLWLPCLAGGILVSQPGIKPEPTAVKAPSLNHWTAREFWKTISNSICLLVIGLFKFSLSSWVNFNNLPF